MLKQLRLQNLILVEQADIPFGSHLNIMTGETGAGKSAIMNGLSLAVGERSDITMIRKGCEKGTVEAVFDIDNHPHLIESLIEAGIEHEPHQELIIRRELTLSGKSRIFINNQQVQLTLLRKIGSQLAQVVGQHANQKLFSLDYHRDVLDLFGELGSLQQEYSKSFAHENALKQKIDTLINQEAQRLREIDICQREIEELEEAQLKENEDEELFAEYTLLSNGKELAEKVSEINQSLSGERQSILMVLNRVKSHFEAIAKVDPTLSETNQSLQNALLELQEISHTMRRYQGFIQDNPERLIEINERLTLLSKLKRKYGENIQQLSQYLTHTKNKLAQLQNVEFEIEDLQKELRKAETMTHERAQTLSSQRQKAAQKLAQALTLQLHALNMPKAQFMVDITPQKRTASGDDKVEFFLQPNIGEHRIPLKEGASGGEMARVLLALQTLLAGKEQTPTLIFDEIDANIGGETAAVIGDKLKEIGQKHQVICVTHFPQVAKRAQHHLQISKLEKDGRTITMIECLDKTSQKKELQRMVGEK